ncbi:MAG: hypothetical protein CMJ78_11275 [Planctomycetaceae bacterium]|nr:hypothetical protein [Planctomycetaceae bacterium]
MFVRTVTWALITCVASVAFAEAPKDIDDAKHWAFRSYERPQIPDLPGASNPIDAFILRDLKAKDLDLSPPASRGILIRRAYFDLLGLPPSPIEVRAFVNDPAANAYERMIDRLLASPHYGEHWGRHWLDLVRYAETAGFNADPARPLAYKYREYIVKAFNSNTPYDRFLKEQIAGDELYPENTDALAATGFNLMWPDESNASNVLLARQDALNDLTTNVGAVFLGVSIGCAQCHDHKFDPLLQTDFYRLQSFFVGIVPKDRVPVGTGKQLVDYEARLAKWRAEVWNVHTELYEMERDARIAASEIKRLKFPKVVLDAIDAPPSKRTALQHQLAFWSERQIVVSDKQLEGKLSDAKKKRRAELKKQFGELKKSRPQPPSWANVMASVELETGAPPTFLLEGGSYDNPSDELQPGFLSAIIGDESKPARIEQPRPSTSGRRTALAEWMTDANNPLTPRVIANRLWQSHFGRGLVSNANDFGQQTPPPTHPDLLNWLADELMHRDWDLKSMHRLIMTSRSYRQSALFQQSTSGNPNHFAVATALARRAVKSDPGNRLYWHYPRRRLAAESIRDSMLSVSGLLNEQMHGASVRPSLPPNFSTREKWAVSKSQGDHNRRSVYIYAKRNLPYPLLNVFDFPDMHESCALRAKTTVAPQALMLLNSELILQFAKAFANRLRATTTVPEQQIANAYMFAFGRMPEGIDQIEAQEFLQQQSALIAKNLDVKKFKTEPDRQQEAQSQAMIDLCHALLNANEFLYLD